jgi:hypothetical protein
MDWVKGSIVTLIYFYFLQNYLFNLFFTKIIFIPKTIFIPKFIPKITLYT